MTLRWCWWGWREAGASGFGAFVLGDEVPAWFFGEVIEVWDGGADVVVRFGVEEAGAAVGFGGSFGEGSEIDGVM